MYSEPELEQWPEYCNPTYIMPSRIEVKVSVGQDSYYFPVAIAKMTGKKPFLGGFRDKRNGSVYHHASSQTPSQTQQKTKDYSNLRSRDTQTYETRSLSIQPNRESSTQMERPDLKLDNKRDKVLYPRTYFTSDELLILKKAKVIEIQRYWRGYMARCRARGIRQRNVEFANKIEEIK